MEQGSRHPPGVSTPHTLLRQSSRRREIDTRVSKESENAMTSTARMLSDPINGGLASPLVRPDLADVGGGEMVRRELTTYPAAGAGTRRVPDRRRGPIALLTAVTSGLSVARDARTSRERLEQELGHLIRARSVVVREEGVARGPGVCVEVPGYSLEGRARLEVTFEPGRTPDGWTTQLLEVGAHIAALLLEVERAQARSVFRAKPSGDGARRSLVRAGPSRRCGNGSSASRRSISPCSLKGSPAAARSWSLVRSTSSVRGGGVRS